MSDLRLIWSLSGSGWADCTVSDHEAEAAVVASYISAAPEVLLTAVARLVAGESETRAELEAEPTEFRWIFYGQGEDVWLRILQLPTSGLHDNAGTEIWASWETVDSLARAVVRCFDNVATTYGESGYHGKRGHPFPRAELESLRRLWRDRQSASSQ